MNLKGEIMRRIEELSLDSQRKVLAYFDQLEQASPKGEPGKALLPFTGVLDNDAAAEIEQAVEAGCGRINALDW